jgi:CDP-diacylglycerol--inositol 3-phosphatidyltransferase
MMPSTRRQLPVALYIPNLMGYTRVLLAFVGLYVSSSKPVTAIWIWLASASLDACDGIVARSLGQTSSLGILIDICADNILRSSVWMAAATSRNDPMTTILACFFTSVEWTTMMATQLSADIHWKHERHEDPWLIRTCFRNNFRNPLGFLVMYGLFSAGMWTFGQDYQVFHDSIPFFEMWRYLSYVGRAIALCIELWMCLQYVSTVIEKHTKQGNELEAKQK